jgi:cytochrome c-type biogenesis protein CcmH/NrfG
MFVYPVWPILMTGVVLLVAGSVTHAAQGGAEPEPSLEPEFRQLRERLGGAPEFQGSDAATKFRLAEELAHRGDIHGAIKTYREAIQLKPDWADPYRGLGQVLLDHHDYAEATEALESSIRLGRDDHQTFYWLGRARMGNGDLPAADAALVRATQLKPDDADAFADLGLVRMAQGDVAGADHAITRSIQLKPDLAEAHRLRELLAKGRDPDAPMKGARSILHDLFARE